MPQIKKEWIRYKKNVYPKGTSVIQDAECRKAFYAGAFTSLEILIEELEKGGDLDSKFKELYQDISTEIQGEILTMLKKS